MLPINSWTDSSSSFWFGKTRGFRDFFKHQIKSDQDYSLFIKRRKGEYQVGDKIKIQQWNIYIKKTSCCKRWRPVLFIFLFFDHLARIPSCNTGGIFQGALGFNILYKQPVWVNKLTDFNMQVTSTVCFFSSDFSLDSGRKGDLNCDNRENRVWEKESKILNEAGILRRATLPTFSV